MTNFIARIVDWLSAGYPDDVPGPDRVPLLALLRRRLTDDEVKLVAERLIELGKFDRTDVGVLITQVTDDMPSEDDIERVRQRLILHGWPFDDPRHDWAAD